MGKRNGSSGWTWLAVIALGLAAYPLLRGRPAVVNKPSGVSVDDPAWAVPGEIVVDLKDGASRDDIQSLSARLGVPLIGDFSNLNPGRIFTVSSPPSSVSALLSRLRQDPLVEAVEPQHLFRI